MPYLQSELRSDIIYKYDKIRINDAMLHGRKREKRKNEKPNAPYVFCLILYSVLYYALHSNDLQNNMHYNTE